MSADTRRVVFDFGAVVFRWRPAVLIQQVWPTRAFDEASARHWAQQFFQGYSGDWGAYDQGLAGAAETAERIAARTGVPLAEVQAVFDAIPAELQPLRGTLDLIDQLAQRGRRLHYLSNMPAPLAAHLVATQPVLQRFESGIFSSTVKISKPTPAIFTLAETQFGARPDELVFLDDHPANIDACRARGWDGILFETPEQAGAELAARGLL